jgi:SagB-type dehydrogenase family enzyme
MTPGSAARSFEHKEYQRMKRIDLPPPSHLDTTIEEVLRRRSSLREPRSARAFTAAELGTLLGLALGIRNKSGTRMYPSGGALYPTETYLIGNILEGHPAGIFHYHPTAHALEHLWELPSQFDMEHIIRSRSTARSSALMVFTSVWERSNAKYGDYSYYLALIEAGHMAQNILLVATALDIQTRPIGGIDDAKVTELLNLNPTFEQPTYGIVLAGNDNKALPTTLDTPSTE